MLMFWTYKLSFDEDIFGLFFGLVTVLATFSKIWQFFPNLLVTLVTRDIYDWLVSLVLLL
jgi:hypothetical protein